MASRAKRRMVGTPSCVLCPRISGSAAEDEVLEERLLHVQAVLRLVEDGGLGPVDEAGGDLLAPVRRQTMEHDGVAVRLSQELLVHLVARERLHPRRSLLLLAHADEHVGDHHVRPCDRLFRIAADLRPDKGSGGRAISIRSGEPEVEAEDGRRLAERERHVGGAIADEGDRLPFHFAELLLYGEEICEHLDRMSAIREPVDHRNRGSAGEGTQPIVAVGAEHDRVDVARGDPGRVLQRLAARDLAVRGGQRDRVPAELSDGGLEGDAGARGRLFEQQQERTSLERAHGLAQAPLRLQLVRAPEEGAVLVQGEVREPQEIPLHNPASFSSASSRSSRGTAELADAAALADARSDAICASSEARPVPPAFLLRATESAASAARSTSGVKRGSIWRARSSGARLSAIPWSMHRRTSAPVSLYAVRKGTPACVRASATSVAAVAPSSSALRPR